MQIRPSALAACLLIAVSGCGITGSDDATGTGAGQTPTGSGTAAGTSAAGAGAAPSDGPTTAPATAAPATTVDPGTLPQTETKPIADDPELAARVQAMWDGIVADDPELAMPFFFPLAAYKQIKDLKDPTGDWNNRLVATYKREIRDLHKVLGANAAKAELIGIEIPQANPQWIKPGVEYNKGPYWRVFGSKVRYSIDGKERTFVVQSLISWRGQWYVVHLTAPPR